MATVRITVQARDILFQPAMFGNSITVGQRAQIAEGVTLRNDGGDERRSADSFAPIFHYTLEILEPRVEAIGIALIAAWLYDRLRGHVHPERGDKVTIERTVVELEQGEITRVLTEKLTSETSVPTPKKP